MKIPHMDIFWQCIAGPFLSVVDMAIFESALDSHGYRLALMLPMPPAREIGEKSRNISQESNYEIGRYPYERMISLSTIDDVELINEQMKKWCERRHFKLPSIHLHFQPSTSRHAWDLMNYIESLTITIKMDLSKFAHRLLSLKHFSYEQTISKRSLLCIAQQCEINMKRADDDGFAPSSLNSLHIAGFDVPLDVIDATIDRLPYITTLELSWVYHFNDSHFIKMAEKWQALNSLDVTDCRITDVAIDAFTRSNHQFVTLKLNDCPMISFASLSRLISNCAPTLTELECKMMNFTDEEITSMICCCPNIRKIALMYSENAVRAVCAKCPKISSISFLHNYPYVNVADEVIEIIANSLHQIEDLYLGGIICSAEAVQRLISNYRATLKTLTIVSDDNGDEQIREALSFARNKVALNFWSRDLKSLSSNGSTDTAEI